MNDQSFTKRLTIRANQSDVERLNEMSAKSGISVSDLIRAGINIALLNEEVFQHYEERQDLLIESMSQKLDVLVKDFEGRMTNALATTDDLMEKMADIIEADRSIIEYNKSILDDFIRQLKGVNTTRPASGGSSPRVGPTGAPILG